jgi:hypothetical protein
MKGSTVLDPRTPTFGICDKCTKPAIHSLITYIPPKQQKTPGKAYTINSCEKHAKELGFPKFALRKPKTSN